MVAALAAGLSLSGLALADPAVAKLPPDPPNCGTLPALSAIGAALDRTGSRIATQRPLTIVAIGSSSTQGVGASSPSMSYPSRLEWELSNLLPNRDIRVINHGVGGQDVGEEFARLNHDVIAEHPDLVIWQVGTNAVLRRDDLSADEQLIRRGVDLMRENGIDVVLMDLQYAPRVLARPGAVEMERGIEDIARDAQIGLFRRFEIMREWDRTHQFAPAAIIGPDGLHMTDTSYGCLGRRRWRGTGGPTLSGRNRLTEVRMRSPE
jgi:acyl-CoA thioesterase I